MGSTEVPLESLENMPDTLEAPLSRPAPLLRTPSVTECLLSRIPSYGSTRLKRSDTESANSKSSSQRHIGREDSNARRLKMRRLFKQGAGKVMRERAEEMERRSKLAAYFVQDAFNGRLKHGMAEMSRRPWYIFAAFRLQTSKWWLYTIFMCNVVHSLLVFFENPVAPANGGGGDAGKGAGVGGHGKWLEVVGLLCVGVYLMDVLLKVSYMGVRRYLKKPWQSLFVAIVMILAVDATRIFGPVPYTRPLRPAVLSLRTRSVRRFYSVVGNMLPIFLRVCVPVMFFMLLSASYAAMAFGREKQEFSDPASSGYSIWVLMAFADNYDSLVNEGLSQNPVYLPFVVMILLVGSVFLLSLLMGVTYDVFIEYTTKQVNNERIKELQGLTRAFTTMDMHGTGKLSSVVWDRFLQHLMPKSTWHERALHFEIASNFQDKLGAVGFLDLRRVLEFKFICRDIAQRRAKYPEDSGLPRPISTLLRKMIKFGEGKPLTKVITGVIIVDTLLLPYSIPHQGPPMWVGILVSVCGLVLLLEQVFHLLNALDQRLVSWERLKSMCYNTLLAACAVILHAAVAAMLLFPPLLSLVCSSEEDSGRGSDLNPSGGSLVGGSVNTGPGVGLGLGLGGGGEGMCLAEPQMGWIRE
ncbi:unnamed protein product, partial [Discosporangium mesarthrocarpum]